MKMKKAKETNLKKLLDQCQPGDLLCVDWYDASIGKSLGSGLAIDVPVKSWGVFVGALGVKSKHIILAQNNFHYADGVYDVDYTAVPVAWTVNIQILLKEHVQVDEAKHLLNSFLVGGRRTKRKAQMRVANHESD